MLFVHEIMLTYFVDDQYTDLMKKRQIVLNDKAKIAAVIAELDEKKNEALKKAYEQVNRVSPLSTSFSCWIPQQYKNMHNW